MATPAAAAASVMRRSFVNIVRERFFAVDMLAQLQGRHGCEGMRVFGGADNHGIDIVRLIVKSAKVGGLAGLGKFSSPLAPGSWR